MRENNKREGQTHVGEANGRRLNSCFDEKRAQRAVLGHREARVHDMFILKTTEHNRRDTATWRANEKSRRRSERSEGYERERTACISCD